MADKETTMWGIHAGATGDADNLFLKRHYVAIGWHEMGDLGAIPPSREAFKAKYAVSYPDSKPGAIPVGAGQVFRFVHEMQPGHLVAYPAKQERRIHLGRVMARTATTRASNRATRICAPSNGCARSRAPVSRRVRCTKSARP